MSWSDQCVAALTSENLFEDYSHQTRFMELMDCFSKYPFFTKGLCKCMWLSAWDEEHFCILLETLTDLSLGRETTTKEMRIKGDALAEENVDDDACIYRLSCSLLDNTPFSILPEEQISERARYVIRRALQASNFIDDL